MTEGSDKGASSQVARAARKERECSNDDDDDDDDDDDGDDDDDDGDDDDDDDDGTLVCSAECSAMAEGWKHEQAEFTPPFALSATYTRRRIEKEEKETEKEFQQLPKLQTPDKIEDKDKVATVGAERWLLDTDDVQHDKLADAISRRITPMTVVGRERNIPEEGAINSNTVRQKLVLINQTDVSFLREYLTGQGKQGSSVLKNYANVTIQSTVRMFSVKRHGL
ncbi:hypothetical protein K0M31_017955 [Melipona bicolor]|uniref:Uncharacterized protein n=1 Tax=Melipona bicolor TaxID=60889 RepID=A0AA40G5X7_9HYME|nr:hypothetical protein K0M31_017955 [Melipona bicolor]